MAKPYRIALIGTGGIARLHAQSVHAQGDRAELVAVADVDKERAEAFAQEHEAGRAYDDAGKMLAEEKPDLVHVCTPPMTHCDLSVLAMEAGAWVLCEKPLVASLAELDRLQEAEAKTGCYVSSVFQWRFGSGALHFRELLHRGELGRLLVAVCHTLWYRDAAYYDVPWRGGWHNELGGPTMGHGIHAMDLLLHLLGPFTEVRADAATLDRDIEVEDVSIAVARFESGAMASIINSVLSPRQESYLRLDTQKATVELSHLYSHRNENWRVSATPGNEDAAEAWKITGPDVHSDHVAQLAAMLDAMDRGERPPVSGEEARRTIEFITCLYKSADTGRAVRQGSIGPDEPYYRHVAGRPAESTATP